MSTATNEWYADSLQAIEHTLYGRTEFPVQVELGGQQFSFRIWQGEQLPDRLLAYDTETAAIEGNEIPQLALATVYGDQGSAYFVHPDQLAKFIGQHSQAYWCCHNAVFDFWVTAQHLQSDPPACTAWWDIAGDSRLICTMLLDSLIRLGRIDAEPINRDLGTVAAEYCNLELNKNDPFRLRYGELIGLPSTAWADTESGFWTYAGADPTATLLISQQQFQIAQDQIAPHRSDMLPDALRRFGPLTACLQVQGAIALEYISKAGVHIDLEQAKQLHDAITELVDQHQADLEQMLPGCFKRYGPRSKRAGELQRTAAGVPRRDAKLIKGKLEQIAKASTEPIRPPRNKDKLVTDSVEYWKQHQDLDPFVQAYVSYSQQAKLAQFFKQLDQQRIYPRYRPLVRSGRSSCSSPNLQQLPRDGRFRQMITAPPGHWLLQIDYSVLELRVLAQICLRRYGHSRLADLFRQGVDCHKYTAASLMGITLEQFEQLPAAEQKQHRQRAKAIGFGVPGGLGAVSLVAYAKTACGIEMSIDEAKRFRQKLINETYPELRAYLADRRYTDLAANLQTTESLARQALPQRDQLLTAARIASGCEATPDGDNYEQELIDHVWLVLQQLNRNSELMHDLVATRPSSELMRRIFYGNAVTLSGRLRGHVNFTQCANSGFQGLAADGCKLALFRLLRAGFQLCGFVHDEMLVLIPDGTDYDGAVQQVQSILCESMQELCPDIPICCEYLLADRWYKDVDEQPRDDQDRIVPYLRQLDAEQPSAEPEAQRPAAPTEQSTAEPAQDESNRSAGPKSVYDPDTIWSSGSPTAEECGLAPSKANGRSSSKPSVCHSSAKTGGKDEWETPPELFALLDQEFHFTLDVSAEPHNAKCRDFFTPDDNGLTKDWQGSCWMNPPYSQAAKWMAKAYESARDGTKVVCLVPSRTGTQWWHKYAAKGQVRLLKGRLKFVGAENSAPFDSAVVIFGNGVEPGMESWDWREAIARQTLVPNHQLDSPQTELFVGDCRELLPKLAARPDLVFADPPFNIGEAYGTWNDNLPWSQYVDFTHEWIDACLAVLAPHGSIWIHVPDEIAAEIVMHLKGRGLEMVNWCLWHYRFGQCRDTNFIRSKEHGLYFVRDRKHRVWNPNAIRVPSDRATKYNDKRTRETKTPGMRVPFDVWGLPDDGRYWGRVQGNNKERRQNHENQLPELYLARIVKALSNEGDLILDPFAGSGTTGTVARALNRRSIGIEIDPTNAASALERIKNGPVRDIATNEFQPQT